MSYLVLARKYRPRRFGEVTGQETVTRTLQGAIGEGRVAHAYLLCGPRGTGKTTTARLFAKALNCERGPIQDPCCECERCLAADAGNEADIIEIDAASHTGVDHVRELREQAGYAPMRARHKVYIIDEVHMLSRPAFNALLKTLEEPPPHVKFLFATTEPHKLPDTILSRCQVLQLAALSEADIESRLDEVFRLEGIQAEAGVSAAIARRARGGMRDALSLADQLLAQVGDAPKVADTARLAAGVDREGAQRLIEALVAGDRAALLTELAGTTAAETELLESLFESLRAALLLAHCGAQNPLVEVPDAQRESLAGLARQLGAERLELMLEELLACRDELRLLPSQARVSLELCLLRLARPETTLPLGELTRRLAALEERLGGAPSIPASSRAPDTPAAAPPPTGPSPAGAPAPRAPAPPPEPELEPDPGAAPAARRRPRPAYAGALRSSKGEAWKRFLQELGERAASLAELLGRHGRLLELGEGRALVRCEHLRQADRPLIQDPRNLKLCAQVLSDLLGEPVEVQLEDGADLRSGNEDAFTREVRDLFGGQIQE